VVTGSWSQSWLIPEERSIQENEANACRNQFK
jgi:hypothetical protein